MSDSVPGYTIRSYYATLSKVFPSSLARTEKNATRRAQIISLSNKIQVQGILHITAAANLPRSAPNFEWPLEDRGGCQDAYPACDAFGLNIRMIIGSHCGGCRDAYPECNRRLTHDRPLDWASPIFSSPHSPWGCEIKEAAVDIN